MYLHINIHAFSVFLTLFFVNISATLAQEGGDRWIYVVESGDDTKFYVERTYKELSDGKRLVWEKQVKKNGTSSLSRVEYDCAQERLRGVQYIEYDRQGKIIDSGESPDAKWETYFPESVGEALFGKVCANKRVKPLSNPEYRTPKTQPATQEVEDLGVDYAVVTAIRANLRDDANANSAAIRELPQGDVVVLLSRDPVGPWHHVIHVKSNQEGWIHSSTITVRYTRNRKPSFTIPGSSTGSSKNPTLEVKNDSDKTMTLKLGDTRYVFPPYESKTIPLSPARYSFHASAPNVIPDFGDQTFEIGYIYNWRFYIVTVRR